MNQKDKKKEINTDNTTPKGDDKKKPRFNIYWIYGIVFLVIIGWNFFRTVNSAGIEIDQQKFYSMVLQGDVVKMKTVGNKEIVRVFINTDSLKAKAEFYKKKLNFDSNKNYEATLVVKPDQPQLFFLVL